MRSIKRVEAALAALTEDEEAVAKLRALNKQKRAEREKLTVEDWKRKIMSEE